VRHSSPHSSLTLGAQPTNPVCQIDEFNFLNFSVLTCVLANVGRKESQTTNGIPWSSFQVKKNDSTCGAVAFRYHIKGFSKSKGKETMGRQPQQCEKNSCQDKEHGQMLQTEDFCPPCQELSKYVNSRIRNYGIRSSGVCHLLYPPLTTSETLLPAAKDGASSSDIKDGRTRLLAPGRFEAGPAKGALLKKDMRRLWHIPSRQCRAIKISRSQSPAEQDAAVPVKDSD
jgi:hypothetical protein